MREDASTYQLSSDSSGGTITLLVTAPLPKPLPKLRWPVRLTKLPATAIATEFINPLLDRCIAWQSQIESLVNELKNKDHVIERLCDRLETSGDFLTTVFPGKSNIRLSKHKPQREQLAPHVPGLAPYDSSAAALRGSKAPSVGAEDSSEFIDNEGLKLHRREEIGKHEDEWWRGLRRREASHSTNDGSHKDDDSEIHTVSKAKQPDDHDEDGEDQFEQFDRQHDETEAREGAEPTVSHDDATEDETEDDMGGKDDVASIHKGRTNPQVPTSSPQPSKSMPVRKIGTLGGLKTRPPNHATPDDTSAGKPKPRLGTLGGKAAKPSAAPTEAVEDTPEVTAPQRPKSKLGALGGKRKVDDGIPKATASAPKASAAVAQAERVPTPQVDRAPAKSSREDDRDVRASSQERADLKRDQLKRQLEDKAKVSGKKKRKF